MAFLRQCLQEVRTRSREWDVPDDAWPDRPLAPSSNSFPGVPDRSTAGIGPVALHAARESAPTFGSFLA